MVDGWRTRGIGCDEPDLPGFCQQGLCHPETRRNPGFTRLPLPAGGQIWSSNAPNRCSLTVRNAPKFRSRCLAALSVAEMHRFGSDNREVRNSFRHQMRCQCVCPRRAQAIAHKFGSHAGRWWSVVHANRAARPARNCSRPRKIRAIR